MSNQVVDVQKKITMSPAPFEPQKRLLGTDKPTHAGTELEQWLVVNLKMQWGIPPVGKSCWLLRRWRDMGPVNGATKHCIRGELKQPVWFAVDGESWDTPHGGWVG